MTFTQAEVSARRSLLRRGILPLIERGDSLEAILNRLILNVEAQTDKMMAAVFFHDPSSNDLCVGAAPNLQPVYLKAVNGFKVGPQQPACGSTVFRGERVICSDVKSDPLWTELLPYAEAANIHAVWSQPLFNFEKKVLGTLAFYFSEPKRPDSSDLVVLESSAELVALAIQSRKSQFEATIAQKRIDLKQN